MLGKIERIKEDKIKKKYDGIKILKLKNIMNSINAISEENKFRDNFIKIYDIYFNFHNIQNTMVFIINEIIEIN